jgi:hypothetical protein
MRTRALSATYKLPVAGSTTLPIGPLNCANAPFALSKYDCAPEPASVETWLPERAEVAAALPTAMPSDPKGQPP